MAVDSVSFELSTGRRPCRCMESFLLRLAFLSRRPAATGRLRPYKGQQQRRIASISDGLPTLSMDSQLVWRESADECSGNPHRG